MIIDKTNRFNASFHHKISIINKNEFLLQSLNGLDIFILLLSANREIIFVNTALRKALNMTLPDVIGKRPGDIFACKYSFNAHGGCGFGDKCVTCDIKNLIIQVVNTGTTHEGNVSLVAMLNGLELTTNFSEKVTHLSIEDEDVYMVAFVDRTNEVEKYNLERVFFHDILNSASSVYNVIRLLRMENEKFHQDQDVIMLEAYMKSIIDEIEYQRNISQAERNFLKTKVSTFNIQELCKELVSLLHKDERFHRIPLKFESNINTDTIQTDKTLLSRIILNIVKNALEANKSFDPVNITLEHAESRYIISVHNTEVIPIEMQRNLLTKGHSSKGAGRGFGTYGSKLLLNKYLDGDLTFTSNNASGTFFYISLPKVNL